MKEIIETTPKDVVILVIKKSLAKMYLKTRDPVLIKIVEDLNQNGLDNFEYKGRSERVVSEDDVEKLEENYETNENKN